MLLEGPSSTLAASDRAESSPIFVMGSALSTSQWSKEKKLSVAIGLAFTFCIVEVIGGFWAHSLAILSDAAHLLTDIMGFAITLGAIVVSKWAKSAKFSYGFKRAEIVGAFLSILIIWMLTGWLLIEAFGRLYSYYKGTMEPIDGKMMSAVALFGIIVNLTIAVVFSEEHGSGFSFHDHSGHDHSHGHAHGHDGHAAHGSDDHDEEACSGHGHGAHAHDSSHNSSDRTGLQTAGAPAGYGAIASESSHGDCSDHGHGHGHGHGHAEVAKAAGAVDNGHGHGHGHEHADGLACTSHDTHDTHGCADGLQGTFQGQPGVPSDVPARDVNMEAAYMHVLTDLITGVGVLISGLLIWYDERFLVVDPCCTLIFAGLVMQSTFGIVSRIFNVLFEGVPDGVDYFAMKRGLEALEGVTNVHHLHVWSVSSDHNCMSCHICVAPTFSESESIQKSVLADYHRKTLQAAQKVCKQNKVDIVTIQIEDFNGVAGCATHACDLNCAGPEETTELALSL